jgi:hypothetical protein
MEDFVCILDQFSNQKQKKSAVEDSVCALVLKRSVFRGLLQHAADHAAA